LLIENSLVKSALLGAFFSVLPGRAGNNFYLKTEVLREKVEMLFLNA